MNSIDTSSQTRTKRSPRTPASGRRSLQADDYKMGDKGSDEDSKSTSDDMELNNLSEEDGLQDDEETGLTGRDKGKRRKKRRRNTLLNQRIVPETQITPEEKKAADQSVVKKGVINGVLIGLWYLFSLSISIVSPVTLCILASN